MIWLFIFWILPAIISLSLLLVLNYRWLKADDVFNEGFTLKDFIEFSFNDEESLLSDNTFIWLFTLPIINFVFSIIMLYMVIYTFNQKYFDDELLPDSFKIWNKIKKTLINVFKYFYLPITFPYKLIKKIFNHILNLRIG